MNQFAGRKCPVLGGQRGVIHFHCPLWQLLIGDDRFVHPISDHLCIARTAFLLISVNSWWEARPVTLPKGSKPFPGTDLCSRVGKREGINTIIFYFLFGRGRNRKRGDGVTCARSHCMPVSDLCLELLLTPLYSSRHKNTLGSGAPQPALRRFLHKHC